MIAGRIGGIAGDLDGGLSVKSPVVRWRKALKKGESFEIKAREVWRLRREVGSAVRRPPLLGLSQLDNWCRSGVISARIIGPGFLGPQNDCAC